MVFAVPINLETAVHDPEEGLTAAHVFKSPPPLKIQLSETQERPRGEIPLSLQHLIARNYACLRAPIGPSLPYPPPTESLAPYQLASIGKDSQSDLQGVVNICSPVKTALAPAMKHIACSASERVCRPAAKRMIVEGIAIRAVAMVRSKVWCATRYKRSSDLLLRRTRMLITSFFSRGVPSIGTKAFTGNDSGCSGMLRTDENSNK